MLYERYGSLLDGLIVLSLPQTHGSHRLFIPDLKVEKMYSTESSVISRQRSCDLWYHHGLNSIIVQDATPLSPKGSFLA